VSAALRCAALRGTLAEAASWWGWGGGGGAAAFRLYRSALLCTGLRCAHIHSPLIFTAVSTVQPPPLSPHASPSLPLSPPLCRARLRDLADRVGEVQAALAPKLEGPQLTAAVREAEERLARQMREGSARGEARAAALSAQLENALAEVAGVRAAASGSLSAAVRELRAELGRLAAEVGKRAYIASLEETDEAAAGTAQAVASLGGKVDVCLRFIEWYAEKGEAYDYNSEALERHMNALAVGNRARTAPGVRAVGSGHLAGPPGHGRGGLEPSFSSAAAPLPRAAPTFVASTAAGGAAGEGAASAAAPAPVTGSSGVRIGGLRAETS